MTQPQKARDALRAAIFDSKNMQPRTELVDMFDQQIEIRQPTVGQVTAMGKLASESNISAVTQILVGYAYVPGTDEKVFTQEDASAINDMPSGPWLTALNRAVEKLTGVTVKEAEKNSSKTA